jgi:hypothetical protein
LAGIATGQAANYQVEVTCMAPGTQLPSTYVCPSGTTIDLSGYYNGYAKGNYAGCFGVLAGFKGIFDVRLLNNPQNGTELAALKRGTKVSAITGLLVI